MRILLLAFLLTFGLLAGRAQAVENAVDASIPAALESLAARAGVVFVGQVVGIERKGGVVEIRLAVQQPVQGNVGATYTLREWAGLWTGGRERYAPGQRAMWFLHAPSSAGLSSPVDGMDGVVPLVPMGADADALLDVRRLAARVRRQVGQPMEGEAVSLKESVQALSGAEKALKRPVVVRALPVGVSGVGAAGGPRAQR